MARTLRTAVFCFLAVHTNLVTGYWRLACSISQEARIDPILSPGNVSSHVHKVAGGINVQPSSNGQSLQISTCSTCEVQKDKSAYWTPSLYYQHPNGVFESVPNDGMTVYYVGRGGTAQNTKSYPAGFRMISGNPFLRHYDTSAMTYKNVRPIADRVSFRCINEANDLPEFHYLISNQTNCVNGLRAQLNFQSCWNGKDLYLENNAHVAYLSGIDYGDCPPTHPVPIPGMFFEVLYWVNDINQQPGGQFVFANGDPTGYGFHGDFLNAWDQEVLTDAVENCLYTDNGGVVSACAALAPSNDVNFPRNCPQAAPAVNEQITGNLTALPGCNPVTYDEASASHPVCNGGASPTSPSVNMSTTAASTGFDTATRSFKTSTPTRSSVMSTATFSPFTTHPTSPLTTSTAGNQFTPPRFRTTRTQAIFSVTGITQDSGNTASPATPSSLTTYSNQPSPVADDVATPAQSIPDANTTNPMTAFSTPTLSESQSPGGWRRPWNGPPSRRISQRKKRQVVLHVDVVG